MDWTKLKAIGKELWPNLNFKNQTDFNFKRSAIQNFIRSQNAWSQICPPIFIRANAGQDWQTWNLNCLIEKFIIKSWPKVYESLTAYIRSLILPVFKELDSHVEKVQRVNRQITRLEREIVSKHGEDSDFYKTDIRLKTLRDISRAVLR